MFKNPSFDPSEVSGKRAIVTGASRGIGAQIIVARLLDGGATVVAAVDYADAVTTPVLRGSRRAVPWSVCRQ